MPETTTANLTRKELAEAVVERLGFSQSACADIVDSVFESMKGFLLSGEPIKIVHFGTFSIRNKSPRNGRNPRTGEAITIKKRQTVSFRPSRQLREELNR